MERCERNARIMSPWNILLCWSILLAVGLQNKGVLAQDCLFRNDLCDWSNDGDVDWVQRSDSASTGTEHCAEVLLTDTTPPGPHQAVLASMTQPHVMTMLGFYYRLGAPNTLTVVAEVAGRPEQVLTQRNGTDGAGWIEVDIGLDLQSSNFKIYFKADIPENSTGFVGLTNITLRIGADECASTPCQNGGACIDGNNSFTCVCNSGFKGEVCQIDTNPRPKTTVPPTTTEMFTTSSVGPTTQKQPQKTTTIKIPPSTAPHTFTTFETPPSTDSTIKYGTVSTPEKLPQTNGNGKGMAQSTMIAVIAVASVVLIGVLISVVWLLLYFKKRSWQPRYQERGVSMENVSNYSESIHGKWTSTVDIPGSNPASKPELTPVEETDPLPEKVENIYVASPTNGLVNTGYNIDNMY
ncbi:uncharacterized protein LOC119741618 [Patiria miniata]|uniref:Uncharacterized protein n=1 Tax=Patiria miniata TaxID=46514 RepID=A0A914BBE5_PATMI|nr:uncharacterized protein LOC119741618 [Patiria miniata]